MSEKDMQDLFNSIQAKVGQNAEVHMFAVDASQMEGINGIEDLKRFMDEQSGTVNGNMADIKKREDIAREIAHVLDAAQATPIDFLQSVVAVLCSQGFDDYEEENGGDEEEYSRYLMTLSKGVSLAMLKSPTLKAHNATDMAIALMMTGMKLMAVEERFFGEVEAQEQQAVEPKKSEREQLISDLKGMLDDLL